MKIYENGVYRELTHEEIAAMHKEAVKAILTERSRPLTESEVSRMFLFQQVNTLTVDDNTALRMLEFYPQWGEGISYAVGFKVRYGDKLWRVRQAHTAQVGWEPEMAASLWEQICEVHDGTLDDPIPYTGNMVLEDGKFYHQDYVIYRCFRGSGNPVYHALTDLVGLYVEEI
jgi:hypothetical protein